MARPREFDPDEVLDRCMRLFWSKGYQATSLDDLLRETGLARQSLYGAFGGKHALFLAALRRYRERMAAMVSERFGGGVAPREALREFLLSIAEAPRERTRDGCFIVNSAVELAPRDPEAAEIVAAQNRHLERVFRSALERAREQGELPRGKDPRAVARFLLGFVNGLHVVAKAGADRATLRDMVKVALQALD